LIKGSSLGDEGALVEERLREIEGACIPRKFLSLEGKGFCSQENARIPKRIGMHSYIAPSSVEVV
jgi:hypothetical protein